MPEKRIYIIVAEAIDCPLGRVVQPKGRIAAQCAHVVARMHFKQPSLKIWNRVVNSGVTTIVLSVPDSTQLETLLRNSSGFLTEFRDQNAAAYGSNGHFLTAVCTVPTTKEKLGQRFGHLPLWGAEEVADGTNPLNEDSSKDVASSEQSSVRFTNGDKVRFIKVTGETSQRFVDTGDLVLGNVYTVRYTSDDIDGQLVTLNEIEGYHRIWSYGFAPVSDD